jgi:hypothetical protein
VVERWNIFLSHYGVFDVEDLTCSILYHFDLLFAPCDLWPPQRDEHLFCALRWGVTSWTSLEQIFGEPIVGVPQAPKISVHLFYCHCDLWQIAQVFSLRVVVTCDWRVGWNGTVRYVKFICGLCGENGEKIKPSPIGGFNSHVTIRLWGSKQCQTGTCEVDYVSTWNTSSKSLLSVLGKRDYILEHSDNIISILMRDHTRKTREKLILYLLLNKYN